MAIELYSKATLDTLLAAKLEDAPIDGTTYGRKDGAWFAIVPGAAVWGSITGTVTDQTDLTSYITGLGYITGVSWGSITGTLSSQTDLQTALDGKLSPKTVNSVDMGVADYTLALSDANNIVNVQGDGSSSGYVIKIPDNSSVAFPIGTEVLFVNIGSGYNYINGVSGVTVVQTSNGMNGGYMRKAVKLDTDTWMISSQI